MATSPINSQLRRARLSAGAIVGALVAVGLAISLGSDDGSVWRDLGLAVLGGGIVGGALVIVESSLSSAAEQRSQFEALLSQLSSTGNLNGIDLAGRFLRGVYLPDRGLVASNLEGAVLDDAKLFFCDLRHANLAGASLRGADLSGSTLAFADLTGADLSSAILDDVDLSDAIVDEANLSGVAMDYARVRQTSLRNADLTGAVIAHSFLEGADLRSLSLAKATLDSNQHDRTTIWPDAFDIPPIVAVEQADINSMDLATYLAWRSDASL